MRLLVGDDHIHIVDAAQTMVCDAQQAVRIRGQVNSSHIRALVGDQIEKTRILMGEAVMVLPPDNGCDK